MLVILNVTLLMTTTLQSGRSVAVTQKDYATVAHALDSFPEAAGSRPQTESLGGSE